MKIDVDALKANTDLLALAGRDTELKRAASTGGGEWAGACPMCGGVDRFRVQPHAAPGGLWLCRHCTAGKWRDCIAYVMQRDGVEFQEACETLDGNSAPATHREQVRPARPKSSPKPSAAWQKRGMEFLTYCEKQLWGEAGHTDKVYDGLTPLEYLWTKRGLTTETIEHFRLGYYPVGAKHFDAPGNWGLDCKSVFVPGGIVIPGLIQDELWYLKTRNPKPTGPGDKYPQVTGSKPALFGADNLVIDNEFVLLTEGEFDAMLAYQELGPAASVATLGSAYEGLDLTLWGGYFLSSRLILLAYDNDKAGQDGLSKLMSISPKIHRAPVPVLNPGDKDITDYYMALGNLNEWFTHHVKQWFALEAAECN